MLSMQLPNIGTKHQQNYGLFLIAYFNLFIFSLFCLVGFYVIK